MNDKNMSLIDVKGISKPVSKLIEVVSSAIGVVYLPSHTKRMAKANAEARIIDTETDIEIEELRSRAANRLTKIEVNRQNNIESITRIAIEEMPSKASENTPGADWIANFFDLCQDVSDENLQYLWGKLLAGEVAEPGQYSTRTLQALKAMQGWEAKIFSKYCSTLWLCTGENLKVHARIMGAHNNAIVSSLLGPMEIIHLAEIGLISHKNLRTMVVMGSPQEYSHIEYANIRFQISPGFIWYNPLSWLKNILLNQSFEMEFLTKLGAELLQVTKPDFEKSLMQATHSDLWSVGIEMKEVKNSET
jgi:uncharacterized repeat protein (TIGR03899 family)